MRCLDSGQIESLAVVHGLAPDVDELVELVAGAIPRDRIVIADMGAVIGTHAGPGVIGVAYVTAS